MRLMGRSMSRNGVLLGLFAVVTALLISITFTQTRDRIAIQQRLSEERALLEILPGNSHDNSLLDDTLIAPAGDDLLRLPEPRPIYRARRDGAVTALIVPTRAADGYSGAIDMIVGVERSGSIAGVRVLNHRETPGLGDKIERRKSDWITDFEGHSLAGTPAPDWAVRKDGGRFDQFTGATITPRAVINATRRALEYVAQERTRLFDLPVGREESSGSTQDAPTTDIEAAQ